MNFPRKWIVLAVFIAVSIGLIGNLQSVFAQSGTANVSYNGNCDWTVRISVSGLPANASVTSDASVSETGCGSYAAGGGWSNWGVGTTDGSGNFSFSVTHHGWGSYNYTFHAGGRSANVSFSYGAPNDFQPNNPAPPPEENQPVVQPNNPQPQEAWHGMDIDGWCRSIGHSGASVFGSDAYAWGCTNADGTKARDIDVDSVCRFSSGGQFPYAHLADQNDAGSWTCWDYPQGQRPNPPPTNSDSGSGSSTGTNPAPTLPHFSGWTTSQWDNWVRINSDATNLRFRATPNGNVLGYTTANHYYPLLERSGDWVKIQTNNGTQGWVHGGFVEVRQIVTNPPTTQNSSCRPGWSPPEGESFNWTTAPEFRIELQDRRIKMNEYLNTLVSTVWHSELSESAREQFLETVFTQASRQWARFFSRSSGLIGGANAYFGGSVSTAARNYSFFRESYEALEAYDPPENRCGNYVRVPITVIDGSSPPSGSIPEWLSIWENYIPYWAKQRTCEQYPDTCSALGF